MGSDNGAESSAVKNPLKLNVILHGLYLFDQAEDEIIAYIPDLGTEHQYKAGNWLTETNLEEHADVRLSGVSPNHLTLADVRPEDQDSVKFQGDTDIITGYMLAGRHNFDVGNAIVRPAAKECHCIHATIRLPYPPKPIKSLRRIRITEGSIGGDDSERLVAGHPDLEGSTVQVLTYYFDDENDLRLGDHPWEPALADGYVNLHIFSEPERPPTDDHVRHSFQACIELLAGVDLVLKAPLRAGIPEKTIPGVHEFELQDLVQRQRWLTVLGRGIKEGRDVNTIWDDPTPFFGSGSCCYCMTLKKPLWLGRPGRPGTMGRM